ncbi:hypothetical protein D8817_07565 [Streptococcus gordonii]|uniref:DUF1146 domain-containing protein n=1 Tax=Streptococcus gordonii TaxID=1302 RepID=A0AB34SA32_STRGN|nr:DUF1146 family protein [Streptococcus gordonii]KJQ64745.1 hypothetical protein TZ88_00979 [Streptococcus gordonii]RSJ44158.1 hypothetical protein D8817_07565 [Streptococcus gordonii]
MIQIVFTLSSHLLFIFLSHQLLSSLVNWESLLKVNADNALKIRLLILFLSIALGYLVSLFFLSIYQVSFDILNGNVK